ncbi:hypothetical protein U1Q18_021826 [Sarracenia purpurea var. burkii]
MATVGWRCGEGSLKAIKELMRSAMVVEGPLKAVEVTKCQVRLSCDGIKSKTTRKFELVIQHAPAANDDQKLVNDNHQVVSSGRR